jgi:predicted nucleotidyltransferase
MSRPWPQLSTRPLLPRSRSASVFSVCCAGTSGSSARGLTRLALFGSTARGDRGPESDVDLLIEVDAARRFGLFAFMDLKNHLAALLGRPVDLAGRDASVPWRGRAPGFGRGILMAAPRDLRLVLEEIRTRRTRSARGWGSAGPGKRPARGVSTSVAGGRVGVAPKADAGLRTRSPALAAQGDAITPQAPPAGAPTSGRSGRRARAAGDGGPARPRGPARGPGSDGRRPRSTGDAR